jgi:hypothetical protein
VISALLAVLLLPTLFAPTSVPLAYKAGNAGSYATGSLSCVVFTLQRAAVLTGSFVTNSSAIMGIARVVNPQDNIACQNPDTYYYTTGDVNQATLNVLLPAGTYLTVVAFTNETTSQTWFNITQSFIATYQK